MRSLAIVSKGHETTHNISNQIKEVVKDRIKVNAYCIDEKIIDEFNEEFIVITSYLIKDLIIPKIKKGSKYTIANRVINYRYLGELISLPPGSDVLLVNDHKDTCKNTIENLRQLGIDHLNYYSYFPGIKSYKKIEHAVTPGEAYLSPKCVKKIINIGTREVDITTIVEILLHFNLLEVVGKDLTSRFVSSIIELSKQFNYEANHFMKLSNILQTIVNNAGYGIMYYSVNGEIIEINDTFSSFMNIPKEDIITKQVKDVFPELYRYVRKDNDNDIIKLAGRNVVLNKTPIKRIDEIKGYMITIEDTDEIQEIEHKIRRNKRSKNKKKLYGFNDIVSKSYTMDKTKSLAKKISNSNSTVLITGESGTGKELLAQAIHNESNRRNNSFIPVNFAALSPSLIESELFGYSEGAFTGAKRGGKEGLFERAHKGTIFLDEIGDASLDFQARLLRVLQERQIRRVGGSDIIPVDVRVIAATNKDLESLIDKGKFRQDLFFRLNVLPISIPALKERKEDIKLLLEFYLRKFTHDKFINLEEFFHEDALSFLMKYHWPGNIRELVNVIEYLVNIKDDGDIIKVYDLPNYVRKYLNNKKSQNNNYGDNVLEVLGILYEEGNLGRRKIVNLAKERGINISEYALRILLKQMEKDDLIKINKGAQGSIITEKGVIELMS